MSVARGLNRHAYACISFTDATKLNRPPISNHMPSRHHHPVISIWSQTSKSDVGEQWHTISNSNSVIPFQQHTIPICLCSNATCAIGGIISFPIGHHKRTHTRQLPHFCHRYLSLRLSCAPAFSHCFRIFLPHFCARPSPHAARALSADAPICMDAMYTYVSLSLSVSLSLYIYIYIYTCMYIYIYMYVYIYTCIYI